MSDQTQTTNPLQLSIFELASKRKLMFSTAKGPLSVDDLWDLPLLTGKVNLNDLARELHGHVQASENATMTFVPGAAKPKSDELFQLQFDVVKRIIEFRVADDAAKTLAAEVRAKKQRISQALANKREANIDNMSEQELQDLLQSL